MTKKADKEYESNRKKLMYWLAFLRISRSYTIAYAYKHGAISEKNAYKEVQDLDKVIETYDKFGFVWQNPIEWLDENIYEIRSTFTGASTPEIVSILRSEKSDEKEEIAKELNNYLYMDWPQSGHEERVLVSIPRGVKKNYLFEFLKNALEQLALEADEHKRSERASKYELTKEVVRMDALEKAYNLIMMKAAAPNMPNWEIAEYLGLCPNSVQTVKQQQRKEKTEQKTDAEDDDVLDAHKSINAVIWRYTRFAYVLAENAARGKFPQGVKENKEEKEARAKEYKKKYTRLKPRFLYNYLNKESVYFQKQLQAKGMVHKYANEFLVPAANINRKWRPAEKLANDESSVENTAHENFLKHRRTYAPLPPVDGEDN
ncbi:MAG: hypothetical protein RL541_29 [Pseudomonadota bacterium]|jgi:hypothetical protein